MLKSPLIDYLAALRAVVGYLGEKGHYGWWPCSFFGPGSSAFLAPVFGRTAALAQYTAVANAAARVHDEFLGIGNTHHLFRLPEDMEQDIHACLADPQRRQPLAALVASREAALGFLRQAALPVQPVQPVAGPTLAGDSKALRTEGAWRQVAGLYAAAFDAGSRIYPYFIERSS